MSFTSGLENENQSPSAGPSAKSNNGMNIDPHLSSMRSSVPELQFGDDTLASAADSSSQHDQQHHDTAAILHQAAAAAQASASPSANGQGQHSLINPHLEGLKEDEKAQPFSRSPELRISHKLAERKRRKEMRDMFEELRALLPTERGSKWSKWEILSKGIDYLENVKKQNEDLLAENTRLRKKLEEVTTFQHNGTGGQNNANNSYSAFGDYSMMGSGAGGLGEAGEHDSNIDPALAAAAAQQQQHEHVDANGGQDEKHNEPPLDTDAIRDSLTQVGERVEKME